jgi:hypothetical protein
MIDTPPPLSAKRRIKRIAPLQLGKMLAVVYGLIGLVVIPFFMIMSAVMPQMPAEQRAGFMALGMGFILFLPVMYAIIGFIGGLIGACIYNIVAKWVGGIEVEVE